MAQTNTILEEDIEIIQYTTEGDVAIHPVTKGSNVKMGETNVEQEINGTKQEIVRVETDVVENSRQIGNINKALSLKEDVLDDVFLNLKDDTTLSGGWNVPEPSASVTATYSNNELDFSIGSGSSELDVTSLKTFDFSKYHTLVFETSGGGGGNFTLNLFIDNTSPVISTINPWNYSTEIDISSRSSISEIKFNIVNQGGGGGFQIKTLKLIGGGSNLDVLDNDITNLTNQIGILSTLTTTDKSSLVNAVNEVDGQMGVRVDSQGRTLELPLGTDMNTVVTVGEYRIGDSVNSPHSSHWWYLKVYKHTADYIAQEVTLLNPYGSKTNPEKYMRVYGSSGWTDWQQLATTGKTEISLTPAPNITVIENNSYKINNILYINFLAKQTDDSEFSFSDNYTHVLSNIGTTVPSRRVALAVQPFTTSSASGVSITGGVASGGHYNNNIYVTVGQTGTYGICVSGEIILD